MVGGVRFKSFSKNFYFLFITLKAIFNASNPSSPLTKTSLSFFTQSTKCSISTFKGSLTSTPTTVPTNTPTPTPTHIPQPVVSSEEIHKLMERFAGQYGVDVNVLRHIATCESGFNPSAVNSGYVGLYQFNKTAWINNRRLMGEDQNPDLRFNAEESVQTAAYLISNGKRSLWPNCYP